MMKGDISIIRSSDFEADLLLYVRSIDLDEIASAIRDLAAGIPSDAPDLVRCIPASSSADLIYVGIGASIGEDVSLVDGIHVRFDGRMTAGTVMQAVRIGDMTAENFLCALTDCARTYASYFKTQEK